MKFTNLIISAAICLGGACGLVSCSDFDYDEQLERTDISEFSVKSVGGTVYKSTIDGDVITIKVNPMADVETELKGAMPYFYLPMGATCAPSPVDPQDFTKDVTYTVTSGNGKNQRVYTVKWGPSDPLPDGAGFSMARQLCEAFFPDLGYPGEKDNFNFADSRLYGDLNGYVAFCGNDHIVLMARQYSDPAFSDPALNVQNVDLAFKVFDADDLSQAGNLNTGSLDIRQIKAITSDWQGTTVAVVKNGNKGEFYYWERYTDAPTLLASTDEDVAPATDGSNYIQVAGDITGIANITVNAPRDIDGSQYMIHVENGVITDTQLIKTGYRSDDGNGFQMISPLKPDLRCSYLIGDTEGNAASSIRVYANTNRGNTKVTMPAVLQNMWEAWWVGTGVALARGGARRPYVSSMYINGKYYGAVMLGTGWWLHNDIADIDDLTTRVEGTAQSYVVNCTWSFGGTCDWYYDPETKEARWVTYTDRHGINTAAITCY